MCTSPNISVEEPMTVIPPVNTTFFSCHFFIYTIDYLNE